MVRPLQVLFLTAEAAPLVQVGGLGDAAGSLPQALRSARLDIRVALPLYPWLSLGDIDPGPRIVVGVPGPGGVTEAGLFQAKLGRVQLWLIDGPPIQTASSVYSEAEQDAPRFMFFLRAALEACRTVGWAPDIVHANDWHTAPAAAAVETLRRSDAFWSGVGSVVTVHNLPYLGVGGEAEVRRQGWSRDDDPRLPAWARAVPLAVGLSAADRLTTVSPTYAQEIQTAEFGSGLHEFLQTRSTDLQGILNGIDLLRWDPERDPALPTRYSASDLLPRRKNKTALRKELGLPDTAGTPLVAMVSRLDPQKGVDLALEALGHSQTQKWDFVLLGTGSAELEAQAASFAAMHADRARAVLAFDSGLARRIYGAADLLLVPSRYEPCGVAQMIAMRYGCLPLVRATGGLRDTVTDAAAKGGNGFSFGASDSSALATCLGRALALYPNRRRWRALQRRAMAEDFSWTRSARAYVEVYRQIRRPVVIG